MGARGNDDESGQEGRLGKGNENEPLAPSITGLRAVSTHKNATSNRDYKWNVETKEIVEGGN